VLPRTRRLILREMEISDLPRLASMLTDPVAMAAYEGGFPDDEVRQWFDRQQDNYRQYGYGLWAVDLVETGQMIGQCGITWQDVESVRCPEIGYHISRAFWHQGYAVEAARACRDYAFSYLGMNEIFAIVRDTNIASMNVAIRTGMTIRSRFLKHYRGVDMMHYAFSVRKDEATFGTLI